MSRPTRRRAVDVETIAAVVVPGDRVVEVLVTEAAPRDFVAVELAVEEAVAEEVPTTLVRVAVALAVAEAVEEAVEEELVTVVVLDAAAAPANMSSYVE
jgi:hypothetical protein